MSSFNIQLTTPTRTPSSDLIGSSHPVCFLFAIQYVIISYGVLCFNRLRECPRGLQRPWLIFFFFFFCCFIPLLYVLKENNRYITTTSPQRAFVRIYFTMTSHWLCLHDFIALPASRVCFGKMKRQAGRQAAIFAFLKFFLFKSRQSVTGFQPRRWSPAHTTPSEGARSSVWLASVRERRRRRRRKSREF